MNKFIKTFSLLASIGVWAAPQIQVTADPSHSLRGESVTFRIHVESDVNENIKSPKIPVFSDWGLINTFQSRQLTSRLINGKITSRVSWENTLQLKPLRKGKLKIPSFEIEVGSKSYQTEALEIQVDQVAAPGSNPPQGRVIPGFPLNPGSPSDPDPQDDDDGDIFKGFGGPQRGAPTPQAPTQDESLLEHQKETFFLRAESNKSSIYLGEMLLLSYSIYQKNVPLQNAEIGKFPEFKGFLKEDLLVPKVFSRTPVEFKGETWLRSEIIRYALFPIQTGNIAIDPMVFRAVIPMGTMSDIIQDLLNGQNPSNQTELPVSKSSQPLMIQVKPLPTAPAGTKFTNGVGQFQMSANISSNQVSVDQPFTITMKISGLGNVQAIEESPLKLPPQIESYQSKHQHKFNEDGSGETVFEYLLMPRQPGNYEIPPIEFTYFDPKVAQYKTLKSEAFVFSATGNPGAAKSDDKVQTPAKVLEFSFPSLESGKLQRLQELGKVSQGFATLPLWILQLALYLLAYYYWSHQKKKLSLNRFLTESPWKKTEKKLLSKKDWSASEIAEMLDEWMRLRLTALIAQKDIDPGCPREDFIDDLKSQMSPENFSMLFNLKNLWSDLDMWRFSGDKSAASQRQKSQDWLTRVERLVQSIEKARFKKESEETE